MNKKSLFLLAAAVVVLPALTSANGLSLNGLGTRAQGMGGAFASVADDFSAVFWNPAGAAGFKQTTFGFCASDLMPRMTYRVRSEGPDIDAKTKISHYLGFLAGTYKPIGKKIVLGLGIGTPSAQGAMWNGADLAGLSDGVSYDWSSRLYMFSFSPMAAVKISDAVSVGAALNIDYGNFSSKRWGGIASVADPFGTVDLGQYEEVMNGWGVGATFGVLVKPGDRLSLGLTLRTPSTISFNGSASFSNLTLYGLPSGSDLKRKITWPLGVAGGLSFRPMTRLLLSADVEWRQWSKLERIMTAFAEPAWAPISPNARPVWPLGWKDAIQVRVGGEYALNPATALRAGYYRDPAPGRGSSVESLSPTYLDVLLPTFTSDVFTIGLGKTFGGLQLDFGLEYVAGHTRELDLLIFSSYAMTSHAVVPSVSASYKF